MYQIQTLKYEEEELMHVEKQSLLFEVQNKERNARLGVLERELAASKIEAKRLNEALYEC